MTLGACLAIGVVLASMVALPMWGYGDLWSFGPVGIAGMFLILLVVLALYRKI